MNKRRSFLGLLTSIVFLPFQSTLAKAALPPLHSRDDHLLMLLSEVMADNPAVKRLGEKHLAALTSRRAPGEMLQRLFKDLSIEGSVSAKHLRDHLSAIKQVDFETANLVTMDGWVLAQSEADAITLVMLYRAG